MVVRVEVIAVLVVDVVMVGEYIYTIYIIIVVVGVVVSVVIIVVVVVGSISIHYTDFTLFVSVSFLILKNTAVC